MTHTYSTPSQSIAAGVVVRTIDGQVYHYDGALAAWRQGYGPYATSAQLGPWVPYVPTRQDRREGLR